MSEPLKYHNDVPSYFCESELLNYNIITQKIKDTHQARDYHPYHYNYFLSSLLLLLLSLYVFSDAVKTID